MESSCPSTPRWNLDRPFLTGRFHQEIKGTSRFASDAKGCPLDSFSSGLENPIGCYDGAVQELIVIDDLLFALVGIEGRYISIKRVHGKADVFSFQVDASMDLALQEIAKRIFPLCESFLLIDEFVESGSQFKNGLVNHALAAALWALLLAMVAQLEHQFRLRRLSIQGLWFCYQPMMGSMQALSTVIKKVSANNYAGSAVLNLLQSQAKAMAGDCAVRSLLEKMTHSASIAYLSILERYPIRCSNCSILIFVVTMLKFLFCFRSVNFILLCVSDSPTLVFNKIYYCWRVGKCVSKNFLSNESSSYMECLLILSLLYV
ncbi:hypothetical protein V6Z11_D03G069400 [Gossypium hirsutum]